MTEKQKKEYSERIRSEGMSTEFMCGILIFSYNPTNESSELDQDIGFIRNDSDRSGLEYVGRTGLLLFE